jgi:hypothetical protein
MGPNSGPKVTSEASSHTRSAFTGQGIELGTILLVAGFDFDHPLDHVETGSAFSDDFGFNPASRTGFVRYVFGAASTEHRPRPRQ